MSRTKSAYQNAGAILGYQFISVILSFISKKIFALTLGVAFLGYSSVFSSILASLNLAELGIGYAITCFLYKPLAENDTRRVQALLYIYRRIYAVLGMLVLAIGCGAMVLLPMFVKDAVHPMSYIRGLFLINLLGVVSTYYLAYNRMLLISDQKSYMTAVIDVVLNVAMTLLQILVMVKLPRYELFLLLEVCKTIFANLIITGYCKNRYAYAKGKALPELVKEYKAEVSKFVKDAMAAKVGDYVFYSTDNMIISYFMGSLIVGYLSMYTMVVTTIQTVVIQVLYSLQSVLGNYIFSMKDTSSEEEMSRNYLFINYILGNFCMVCMAFLIQPFIGLYFGKSYVLSDSTAILLSVNLMLIVVSQVPSQLFSIHRMFRYDKWIVACSAILNIAVSIGLVQLIGMNGVFIGTTITSVIYCSSRIWIIWNKIYHQSCLKIYGRMFLYGAASLITVFIVGLADDLLPAYNVPSFLLKAVITAAGAVAVPLVLFCATQEESFLLGKIRSFLIRS